MRLFLMAINNGLTLSVRPCWSASDLTADLGGQVLRPSVDYSQYADMTGCYLLAQYGSTQSMGSVLHINPRGSHPSSSRMLAVILAGGRGSRLHDLGSSQAKPALPFGGSYRLIDFPLSNCLNSGIHHIGVATQYCASGLLRHIQRCWNLLHHDRDEFIEVWPAQQQADNNNWYSGTADAVYQNLTTINNHLPDYVLVLAGDHVSKQDYRMMLSDHIRTGADVTVSCDEVSIEDARNFGILDTDSNGRVTAFFEKPSIPAPIKSKPDRCMASMGIYIFTRQFLTDVLEEDHRNSNSKHDFGHDIFPGLIGSAKVFAHKFNESCVRSEKGLPPYWRDVGTLDAYWRANLDLTALNSALDLHDRRWPVRTNMDQLPGAKINLGTTGRVSRIVASSGVVINQAIVEDSILSTGVLIGPNSSVKECVLLQDVVVGPSVRLNKAIVAENCKLPPGLVVGENAAEDSQWFTRTEKGVTLITNKALEQWTISKKLRETKPAHAELRVVGAGSCPRKPLSAFAGEQRTDAASSAS